MHATDLNTEQLVFKQKNTQSPKKLQIITFSYEKIQIITFVLHKVTNLCTYTFSLQKVMIINFFTEIFFPAFSSVSYALQDEDNEVGSIL